MTYVDPNGQAATWLKNDPLGALHDVLEIISCFPGLNAIASVGMIAIDVAKGDYTSLMADSLGILLPGAAFGAAVGVKFAYDGIKLLVEGLRVGERAANFGIRVGARVVEVADNARAIKSAVQVAGAKVALGTIKVSDEMASHMASHMAPNLALANVGRIAPESGPVTQRLQTFVDSVGSVKSKFLKTYRQSSTNAKLAPDYISPQKHHILQNEWAKKNLAKYGYDPDLAPVIMLETGKGLPHTIITNNQQSRKMVRLMNGDDKWGTSLMDELDNSRNDLRAAGISSKDIDEYMDGVMKMLKKIGVPENEYIR